jgi:hemerythrin
MENDFFDKIRNEHNKIDAGLEDLKSIDNVSASFYDKIEALSRFVSAHMAGEDLFFAEMDRTTTKPANQHDTMIVELISGLKENDPSRDSWTDLVDCIQFIFAQHRKKEEKRIKDFLDR